MRNLIESYRQLTHHATSSSQSPLQARSLHLLAIIPLPLGHITLVFVQSLLTLIAAQSLLSLSNQSRAVPSTTRPLLSLSAVRTKEATLLFVLVSFRSRSSTLNDLTPYDTYQHTRAIMKRGRSPDVSLYYSQTSVEPPRTPTGSLNRPSSRKIMKLDSLSSEDEEGELPQASSSASPKKGSSSPKKGKGTPWTVAEDRVIMEAIVK